MNATLILLLVSSPVGRADQPAVGKILVLDNEQTLEGDIERVGDEYRVKGGFGSATIPAARVVKLCADKQEALGFLRQRAIRENPDEHLRLARWCHVNGMAAEALVEVKKALAMRPTHVESKRLLHYLEQWTRPPEASASKAPVTPAPRKVSNQAISLSAESMGQFTSRVQPILMNACAKCHASNDNGSAFQLERTQGIGSNNRRAVQDNVAAVLAQVHVQQPDRSPLLVKAISAHGDANEAPIKGRKAQAFRLLDDWVRVTLTSNPHLRDILKPPAPVMQTLASKPEPKTTPPPASPALPKEKPAESFAEGPTESKPAEKATEPEPQAEEEPESEFDAAIFNRRVHPGRKSGGSPPPMKDRE